MTHQGCGFYQVGVSADPGLQPVFLVWALMEIGVAGLHPTVSSVCPCKLTNP